MLFDADGRIRRFGSPEEIIEAFAPLRLEYYHKRKAHLLQARNWYHGRLRMAMAPTDMLHACRNSAPEC